MSAKQRVDVLLEANTWMGTPYHHHGAIKGVGVDCAHYLIEVYSGTGAAPKCDPGAYPTDWHLHRSQEMFIEWVEKSGGREIAQPMPGDIALFKFGRTFSHGAIMLTPTRLIHSLKDHGVVVNDITDVELARAKEVKFFTLWNDQ